MPLQEAKQPLPYISLETIETDPAFVLGEYDGWNNRADFHTSFLAPIQYEIRQEGIVPNRPWNDDSDSPSIKAEYHDLRFAFLAEPFFAAMVQWHIDDETGLERLYTGNFDEAIFSHDGSQKLFFRKGDKVMAFFYYGHEELKPHLPEIFALADATYSKDKS